jgi:hypothetical protein
MEELLPELVERFIGGGYPVVVKNVRRSFLPVTCIALFDSDPIEERGVTADHSSLVVCWFTGSANLPVRNIVCEGLADIEWERNARDYHFDW